MDSKYWNDIYKNKSESQMSWFQDAPKTSLELIEEFKTPKDASIIDIGGGDSKFGDQMFQLGYQNISVLDISEESIKKAKLRLGEQSQLINWIVSDVTKFAPTKRYDLWHDRATFHFLTDKSDVEKYLQVASHSLNDHGNLIVSTFSDTGPEKCSGLQIQQYSEIDLKTVFEKYFDNIKCLETTHRTPWGSEQNFIFCGFKKRLLNP